MTPSGYNPLNNDIRYEFAYMTGYELRGVSIQYREDDILTIWKAWDDRGLPVVMFVAVTYEEQAWEYITENYRVVRPFLKFVRDKFHKVDRKGNPL